MADGVTPIPYLSTPVSNSISVEMKNLNRYTPCYRRIQHYLISFTTIYMIIETNQALYYSADRAVSWSMRKASAPQARKRIIFE
jgi:hypothetical protein